jgi:hypothetical protein
VLELQKQGLRERIVKKEEAPDRAFAIGRFDLICEPIDGGEKQVQTPQTLVQISRAPHRTKAADGEAVKYDHRMPVELAICRNCRQYIFKHETACPHCRADIRESGVRWADEQARALASRIKLERALEKLKAGLVSG